MNSSSSQFGGCGHTCIRGMATREKKKGNCTRPGMDVKSSYCERKKSPRHSFRVGSSVFAGELWAR
ncbi:LOW QUALITY PROTEIN: hypothetical protein CFOL_v3_35292, partial [Cephalotus follicularis]